MKRLFICLLWLNVQTAAASPPVWHDGAVVLATGEVLTGKLSVEVSHDLILLQHGDGCRVLPAHKVKSFYYYDTEANINRKFVTWQEGSETVKLSRFFEVVLNGDIGVLRRQKESVAHANSDALDFDYFIVFHDNLISLHKFNQKVYPTLVETSGDKIVFFITSNKLSTTRSADAIRILEFYNQGIRVEQSMASF
ncbi:hypothetical protein [Chryseolinea lacunae]|uniref:DUF4369 domain-containing protein n=1 Tax=Chryseolinea lacunae TaxID=2801331 RepID=A0ABS1KZ20_9BACT|nr:hypothetical protein [Chryseolinea lacunae]MBL0744518.1 hypothetical protein [Chryseolinea lacunae]